LAIAPSTYYAAKSRPPSKRSLSDAATLVRIAAVHRDNYGVYGARKVHAELNRQGQRVARCTVERLMRQAGLRGISRAKGPRTTIAGAGPDGRPDLVERNFSATAPNQLWVADITYVRTFTGWVYAAFVTDVFSRRVVGWSVATTMTSQLVLDAVDQAVWTRQRDGRDLTGLIAHHDHGSQYLSLAYTEHLDAAGIKPSTGAVGSSYDNALAESVIGLYKTELTKPRRPWKGFDDLEIATAEWVDWFNHRRPYEYCDDLTPVQAEQAHYRHHQTPATAGVSN
jgi:putative transposase